MPLPARIDMIQLFKYIENNFGTEVGTSALRAAATAQGVSYATIVNRMEPYKTGRGEWNLTINEVRQQLEENIVSDSIQNLTPVKDKTFIPFGNFVDVKKIIKSRIFYPTFITGMSGNGKTMSIEQACASLNRELIRVNITIETDEDDLIGGFRLVNGETVWHNGPVVEALERGAVLLLDEVDLASNKIMCLQSILEGKGIFLKKTGKYIQPTSGFNIFATANTKGKGSDDGRFIGTNILNEAFLERFALTFEQEYPSIKVEQKILEGISLDLGLEDREFCEKLAQWADIIRKTFDVGGTNEVISTRRLTHIIRAYSIWNDRIKAIKVCTNRFDEETKIIFLDLYSKLDAEVNLEDTIEKIEAPYYE
jgi:MoxR-like ATPase